MPKTSSRPSQTSSENANRFNPPEVYKSGAAGGRDAVYLFKPGVRLAVDVALATGRPLLVRGTPGWGKSSLAYAAAAYLGWTFLSDVISSRTQARDLLWEVDLVKRLNDAQAKTLKPDWRFYIKPGVLWKAFDPVSAEIQEAKYEEREVRTITATRAVVLLDEIDKADPDVPNNLLVPLGDLEFNVPQIADAVKASKANAPLVIITTNEERDLPAAFLRRCVELRLPAIDGDDADGSQRRALLSDIGAQHFRDEMKESDVRQIAERVLGDATAPNAGADLPSPAELIDTLRAVQKIYQGTKPSAAELDRIASITLWKHGRVKPSRQ